MPRETDIIRAFVSIADSLVEGFDVIEMLNHLTVQCAELLDIASAGLLLADQHGVLHVVAASSERTRNLEIFQTQRDEGPCLDCFRTGTRVSAPDLRDEVTRWPVFAHAALGSGFASVHAVPMRIVDDVLGTLGLFGTSVGTLNDEDFWLGQALAHVASVALVSANALADKQTVSAQLRHALDSRVTIEQAKGYLAQTLDTEMDLAYDQMRAFAARQGRHLTEVAREVLDRDLAPVAISAGSDVGDR